MADLSIDFCGVKSPNPFWLASAPPTNTGDQVKRAFDAGWGGAVWKTLGNPIVNVSSRFGGVDYGNTKLMGLNNIELITDRPLDVNLREMEEVKKQYPNNVLIASLMVDTREEWHEIIQKVEDVGSDLIELNFGCPHGMCERGMGSAVGAEPEVLKTIVGWVMEKAKIPVIVKLTPNIGDITEPAVAALEAGADAVSLINTVKSIVGVDLDKMVPLPRVGDASSNGGYCGPAVKPIALHLLGQVAHVFPKPISGIGGIANWRDAAEFMALGSTSVQVCTAVMHYGYRIVEDMIEGLGDFLDEKGMASAMDLVGKAVPAYQGLGQPRPELSRRRRHRSGQVHRLPALLRGLYGWLASVHPHSRHERRGEEEAGPRRLPEERPRPSRHREGRDARRAHPLRTRGGVRRLQPLPARLPGRRVHLHGGEAKGARVHHLERAHQRRHRLGRRWSRGNREGARQIAGP